MNTNSIEVIGLNFKNIFINFSIGIEKNKFISISGPNNCGKTTLIRIIANQIKTYNTVTLYGKKIEDYQITDYRDIVKIVIPTEIKFTQKNIFEEIKFRCNSMKNPPNNEKILDIFKKFSLTNCFQKNINDLNLKDKILFQIALAFNSNEKVILIDDLTPYFNEQELQELIKQIKIMQEKTKSTVILITQNLKLTLESDYLYIINGSKIIIEGKPIEVLEHDNLLNRIGLELPFMMDLSEKLKDYDLIKQPILKIEDMVNALWK